MVVSNEIFYYLTIIAYVIFSKLIIILFYSDLEYRLDYVLPMGSMTNSYVSAIFSHTSYWASPEVALFILSHVFPDYGPVR